MQILYVLVLVLSLNSRVVVAMRVWSSRSNIRLTYCSSVLEYIVATRQDDTMLPGVKQDPYSMIMIDSRERYRFTSQQHPPFGNEDGPLFLS